MGPGNSERNRLIDNRLIHLIRSKKQHLPRRHLGYLERLGLWGKGRPHKTFEELRLAVEGGGLAAMELLAMTMRAEGMLSCRSLSFKGASFRLVPISLGTEEEAPVYVGSCLFWQAAFRIIVRLLKARTREVRTEEAQAYHRAKGELCAHAELLECAAAVLPAALDLQQGRRNSETCGSCTAQAEDRPI